MSVCLGGASITLCFFLLLPSGLFAVTALEQSKRLQLVYAHLLDLRANSAPVPETSGTLEIGADLQPLPAIDSRIGAKTEPVETLPVSGRLRFRGFFPAGGMLGISGIPGLTLGKQHVTALQAEIGLRHTRGRFLAGWRMSASSWKVRGPMTTTRYKDRFETRQQNTDLSVGWNADGWQPYAGFGHGVLNSDLWIEESQITLKIQNEPYAYQFAGVGMRWTNWSFHFEQHRTEEFLFHFQLSATRRF